MKTKILLALFMTLFTITASLGQEPAWLQKDPYVAPDFEAFFPDDAEGGKILDALWESEDKDSRSDDEILETVRNGLRNTSRKKPFILRWIGSKYIWGKSPQHPEAIEIMYHATDVPESADVIGGTRHYAVYFGLSVAKPKTPSILKALADLCITTDDPNTLSRVAWGAKSQQSELLEFLQPYLDSEDESVQSKAKVCKQILQGELNAFTWAKKKDGPSQEMAGEDVPHEMLGSWRIHHAQTDMILSLEPNGKALFLQINDGSHYTLRTSWKAFHGGILVHTYPRMRLWYGRKGRPDELRGELEILPGTESNFPTHFFLRKIKYEPPPPYMEEQPLPESWKIEKLPEEWNETAGKIHTN